MSIDFHHALQLLEKSGAPLFRRFGGIRVNCRWLNAFAASQRNSSLLVSPTGNDFERHASKLFVPPAKRVLRLTVEPLGNPVPSIQWTPPGVTHAPLSGFR